MMNGWESHKIKDLDIKLIDGDRGKQYPKKKEFLDEGYCLFLNTSNVRKDGFDFNKTSFITKEKDELLRKGKLSRHDIILTTRGTIGNIAIYNDNVPFESIRINSGMLIIRTNKEQFNNNYLFQYFKSSLFQEQVKLFQYGAAQPQLPVGTLNHIKVLVPPLKTQRKIASILSGYDDLIEKNLKRIKLLEEQAQQTYEEWFVRFKFPGYENVGIDEESGLPVGWEKTTLEELVSLQQGFALNKKSDHHISKEKTDFPLLKIGDLFKGTETLFVKDTIPKQFLVNENEIIYSRTGQVGHAFMGRKGVIYNNCFRVSANDKIERLLLYYFLISPSIVETAKSLATGSAQPDLNHGAFKSIQINLPSLDIQKKFSVPMEQNLELIYNLQNQNQHLKEARDILLPRLMSGMIDVDGLEVDEGLGMVGEERVK
jgi:type I restriction enzyme S subunit